MKRTCEFRKQTESTVFRYEKAFLIYFESKEIFFYLRNARNWILARFVGNVSQMINLILLSAGCWTLLALSRREIESIFAYFSRRRFLLSKLNGFCFLSCFQRPCFRDEKELYLTDFWYGKIILYSSRRSQNIRMNICRELVTPSCLLTERKLFTIFLVGNVKNLTLFPGAESIKKC